MKRRMSAFLIAILIFCSVPLSAFAEGTVTIESIVDASRGETVVVRGTSTFDRVSITIFSPGGVIWATQPVMAVEGRYSFGFSIPEDAEYGAYRVRVGQGQTVKEDSFAVIDQSVRQGYLFKGHIVLNGNAKDKVALTVTKDNETVYKFKYGDHTEHFGMTDRTEESTASGQLSYFFKVLEGNYAIRVEGQYGSRTVSAQTNEDAPISEGWRMQSVADIVLPGYQGSGNVYVPTGPEEPEHSKDTLFVNEPISNNGKVEIQLADEFDKVMLPAGHAAMMNSSLVISKGQSKVDIPSETIRKLQSLVSDNMQENRILVELAVLSGEREKELLAKAESKSKAELHAAGDIRSLRISLVSGGVMHEPDQLSPPIKLSLDVAAHVNRNLAGLYYVEDDGTLTFIKASFADGRLEAEVELLGHYALLEYIKPFKDVDKSHWAHDVIMKMAARHIVTGVTDDEFKPNRHVTRAEFAALISRALHLNTSDTTPFSDVDPGEWYADAVASAYQAGIVAGRNTDKFAPNALITREEMVVMLIRAYDYQTGKSHGPTSQMAFSDQDQISPWARNAVGAAAELGFVQGKGQGQFAPHDHATRAETVKVISNLIE